MASLITNNLKVGDNVYVLQDARALSSLSINNFIITAQRQDGTSFTIAIPAETALTPTSSITLPTSKAVADFVYSKIIGGMLYKGVVSKDASLPVSASTGWVYVANASFTHGTEHVEPGDWFLYNGTSWDIVNGENQVDAKNPTLAFGLTSTVAIVDGTELKVKMPSETTLSVGGSAGSGTTALSAISVNNHAISYQTISVAKAKHTHTVTLSGNTGNTTITPSGTISVTVTPGSTTFTGSYTPGGEVAVGTFGYTSTQASVSNTLSITGAAHTHSVNLSTNSISISYAKPAANTGNTSPAVSGSITVSALTGGTVSASLTTTSTTVDLASGKFANHSHSFTGTTTTFSGNFTPAGTISKPGITVTPTYGTISAYANGNKTLSSSAVQVSGTATMNSNVVTSVTYTSADELLTITAGKVNSTVNASSGTSKYLTDITLTTAGPVTYLSAASAALNNNPTFTGTSGTVSVSGKPNGTIGDTSGNVTGSITYVKATGVSVTFTGTTSNIAASFTLSAANHSHSISTVSGTTAGTMPTITIGAATSTPSLTGGISVSYDKLSSAKGKFTGSAATISVSGKPVITSATATFYGTAANHSHSFTGTTTSSTEST